ncbi:MAG: hypothetical protein ACRDJM_09795, partial [Actinomycetota bacterium]
AALAAAAGIHLAVALEHFRRAPLHGLFFAGLGIVQVAWALQLMRTTKRSTLPVIAIANAAIMGLWAVSRTIGLPGDSREAVGLADLVATLLEGAVVAGALSTLRSRIPVDRVAVWTPVAATILGVSLFAGAALGAIPGAHRQDHQEAARGGGLHHGIYDDATDPGPQPGRSSSARIDARLIKVGTMPTAIASGFGKLWVTDRELGKLTVIDPATRATSWVRVGAGPSAVASGFGAVWVTDFTRDLLVRLDPVTMRATRAPVGSGPTAVAVDRHGVWVTSIARGLAQLVDPHSLKVVATIPVGFGPTGLALDGRNAWVVNTLDRTVVRIDADTRRPVGDPIDVGAGATGATTAFGRVWVASSTAGTVNVIDPATGVVRQVTVDARTLPGQGPIAVTAVAGRIWVANNHDKTVRSIDPSTLAVGPLLFYSNELGRNPIAVQLTYQMGSLWVTNFQDGTVGSIPIGNG